MAAVVMDLVVAMINVLATIESMETPLGLFPTALEELVQHLRLGSVKLRMLMMRILMLSVRTKGFVTEPLVNANVLQIMRGLPASELSVLTLVVRREFVLHKGNWHRKQAAHILPLGMPICM